MGRGERRGDGIRSRPGPCGRALLRGVSDALATYGVDVAVAREQHAAYAAALREAGVETIVLPADHELADCCFIEDTAVVAGGRARITRMGHAARRPETAAVRDALAALGYRIDEMAAPASLEGGDVLRAGDRVFVGLSTRTNAAGAAAVGGTPVPVRGCLHLKTAVTAIGERTLLLNRAWVDPAAFRGFELVEADCPNALWINGVRFASDAATAERIGGKLLDISEFAKADGGLTCLSLPLS